MTTKVTKEGTATLDASLIALGIATIAAALGLLVTCSPELSSNFG